MSLEVLVAQSGRLALMALLGILVAQRVALAMAVVQVVAVQAGKTAQTATLAVAAAIWVTSMVMPAAPLAATWLPALKPNQPTHSIAAPVITMPGLCGGWSCFDVFAHPPHSRAGYVLCVLNVSKLSF